MPRFLIDDREERRRRGFVREPEQVDPAIAIGEPVGRLPSAEFVQAMGPPPASPLVLDEATPERTPFSGFTAQGQIQEPGFSLGGIGEGFAVNLPETTGEPLSTIGARVEAAQRAQQPGVLERLFAASGRLDRAYLDAAQDPMTKKLKSLQVLTEAIDKLGDRPEALAIFGPVLREFGRTLDLDLDDDTLKAFAGVKGAAPAVATLAQIDPNLAEEFLTAYQRTKDVKIRQSLVETYEKRSLAMAQERGVPQLRQFLADPEDRGRLVNPEGQIPEAALLAELDRPEHQLEPFEKRALADYIQSDKGRAELSQLGVVPASTTLKAQETAAVERAKGEKPGKLTETLTGVLKGAPFGLKDPNTEATPAQITAARKLLFDEQLKLSRERGAEAAARAPLPAAMAGELGELAAISEQIAEARLLFKPAFVGPIKGRVAGVIEATTGDLPPEEIEFRANVRDMQDALLRARSGAQINEQEFKRLMTFLPDMANPPSVFEARLNRFERALQQVIEQKSRMATTSRGELEARPPLAPKALPGQGPGPEAAPDPAPAPVKPGPPEGAILRRPDGSQYQRKNGRWERLP